MSKNLIIPFFILMFSINVFASGPRFWLEPYALYVNSAETDDGTNTSDLDGYGLGLQFFGFFTSNMYLGVNAKYNSLGADESDTITDFAATQTQAGPVLGIFFSRLSFYLAYNLTDEFSTEYKNSGTDTENSFSGTGVSAGINFWIWPHLKLGVEHTQSTYTEDDSGELSEDYKITNTSVYFSFPFELK